MILDGVEAYFNILQKIVGAVIARVLVERRIGLSNIAAIFLSSATPDRRSHALPLAQKTNTVFPQILRAP